MHNEHVTSPLSKLVCQTQALPKQYCHPLWLVPMTTTKACITWNLTFAFSRLLASLYSMQSCLVWVLQGWLEMFLCYFIQSGRSMEITCTLVHFQRNGLITITVHLPHHMPFSCALSAMKPLKFTLKTSFLSMTSLWHLMRNKQNVCGHVDGFVETITFG